MSPEDIRRYLVTFDRYARFELPEQDREKDLDSIYEFENDRSRFKVWMYSSIMWALREYEAQRYAEAMRGLLQVREYVGRLGGFWPSPVAHDASIGLQNALEKRLRTGTAIDFVAGEKL